MLLQLLLPRMCVLLVSQMTIFDYILDLILRYRKSPIIPVIFSRPSQLILHSLRLPPSSTQAIQQGSQLHNCFFTINSDCSVHAYIRDFLLRGSRDKTLLKGETEVEIGIVSGWASLCFTEICWEVKEKGDSVFGVWEESVIPTGTQRMIWVIDRRHCFATTYE